MRGFPTCEWWRDVLTMQVLLTCCVLVTLLRNVESEKSRVDSILFDKSGDSEGIFNKTLASSKDKTLRGARTPSTPISRLSPHTSTRTLMTPPLPRDYPNPFADKPTLRGSNSDTVHYGSRRPIPAPPPYSVPGERIPLPRPDLPHHDTKKKTLNVKKVPDPVFSETPSTTSSNTKLFDENVMPLIDSPISRILYGNERKNDRPTIDRSRLDHDKEPRTIKQEKEEEQLEEDETEEGVIERNPIDVPKHEEVVIVQSEVNEPPPVEQTEPPKSEEAQKQEVTEDHVEAEVALQPERPEPRTRHVLGIAWDIHVYLIASLFSILALCSLINIIRFIYFKHLLSRGYFLSVHGILLIIGCMRSFYLFYDAYNINRSFSEPLSNLLMHMVFPLITSAFAILFLFLLSATEVKAFNNNLQKPYILAVLIMAHLALNFSVHLYSYGTPYSVLLPLICECVFIMVCVGLGLAYLYLYKSLSQSCVHKANQMYRSGECERWSLSHAIRVTLATSMLSLLMAALHLYGMLGNEVLSEGRPQPWLWWGFQLSVRVIEIAMCSLLAWAGMQRDASTGSEQPTSVEDIYPTICTANQAYTLRSVKHYDDTFPLNSLHPHAHTSERRSIKKHPSLDRRLQPSPSMLVAENGFVRFRTIADAELPDETYAAPTSIHEYA